MSATADAAARAEIATALDATLFVEAGAGTGKTYELVGRVVNLVAGGADIRRVAVITFTEAAAAELRERIRERLTLEAGGAGGDRATRVAAAISVIDDAPITTLHGFAQRILTEFSVDAGLPPGFEVLDEVEAEIAFGERWARWCDRMFADPALAPAITVASVLAIGMRQLERVARELSASWDLARDWAPPAERVPSFEPAPVLAAIDAAAALIPSCCDHDDRLLAHVEWAADVAEHVRAALDDLEALELLTASVNLSSSKNRGRKENWGGAKPDVLARLDAAEAARLEAVARVQGPAVRTLLGSVADFVRDSAAARAREGRVIFHDLLVLARDVLRGAPTVRARLHERYEYLLLDEFQDTDPIQIELAVLIAGDDDAGHAPWSETRTEPGRIFTVGDPKQSIYRFRRADIELYSRVRDVFGAGGDQRRALTTNFRSRPGILEFVNEVFAPLMPEATPLQPAYDELHADRDPCAATPDPVRTFGTTAERRADLDELRHTEARELAAIVRRARDDRWQVRDGDDGATRDARFSDIAILLPTRNTLNYLEEALDELDIPTRIESQSLVFATTAVQELLHVLQAIDDPVDDVAIVAALRSPAFACSDDTFVEFVQAGGSWDYRVDPPADLPEYHPVVDGMRALRELHDRRAWDGVSELVERVIRERRLLELAVEHRRPRDHWRRLRFIADAARAYADRGGTSLRGFVMWAWSQSDEEARAVEVIVPEPDDDAVRVLTVHGAKGLEFPIVVLTGLGLHEQPRTGAVIFGPDGPEIRLGYDHARYLTPGFETCKEHEHDAWRAEQLRLLYVALTRAEDHLVVSLHRRDGEKCLAAYLADAAATRPQLVRTAVGKPPVATGRDAPAPDVDRDAWIAARAGRIAQSRKAPVLAATTIARAVTDDDENEAVELPPWRRGRAGSALGRAVHAVLQTIDLATGEGLEATARAQALAEGLTGREDEIRELAERMLEAPAVRAAAAAKHWREVPVAAPVDGVLVEGFIDLLYEGDDGLVVVDYKTDHAPTDADLDAALARYSPQGAAYALALEVALGAPVAGCVFVFARPGGAEERTVADLPGAVAAIRAELTRFDATEEAGRLSV
jgi:ATP-dependent helicase/nuclease subunit A